MLDVVIIRRVYEPKQTLGILHVIDDTKIIFTCKTLELPWKGNKPTISCVPPGSYPLIYERSPKFGMDLYELKDVPGRSETKFHIGNFYSQIQGCILIGDWHLDINGDGYRDVRNSRKTVKAFHKAMKGQRVSRLHIYK